MMNIEVLYFEGCPHHRPTVDRVGELIAALGVDAEVREVEVRDRQEAVQLRFPGSPTVRVNGVDIEAAESPRDYGLSCRLYDGSGVPARELLEAAVTSHGAPPNRGDGRRVAGIGIPVAGLAALPACPACYPLYAGILSSLGLTAFLEPGAQAALTAVFLTIALGALALRAKPRRDYGPLIVGTGAAPLILAGKFALAWNPLTYAGVAILIGASVWNVWPRKAGAVATCDACVAGEVVE